MKKAMFVPLFLLYFAGCSMLQQNINARKNLAKCKYEFEKIEVSDVLLNGIKIDTVNFNLYLKITNTVKSDIALDKILGDIFLDTVKAADLAHKKFVRIKPSMSSVEKIHIGAKFINAVKLLSRKPKNITVKAKVYVSLLIGSYTMKTPYAIDVKKTFPIPYDQINRIVKKKTSGLIKKYDKSKNFKKLKKKFF